MSPVGYAAGTGAGPVHTRFRGPDKMGPESRRARGEKHTDRFPLHVSFVFIRCPDGAEDGRRQGPPTAASLWPPPTSLAKFGEGDRTTVMSSSTLAGHQLEPRAGPSTLSLHKAQH